MMDICEMRCHSAEDISKLKYNLVEHCEDYIEEAGGLEGVRMDYYERLIKMIEHLSHAEMNSVRACYYQTVIDSMCNSEHEVSAEKMNAGMQTEELESVYPKAAKA